MKKTSMMNMGSLKRLKGYFREYKNPWRYTLILMLVSGPTLFLGWGLEDLQGVLVTAFAASIFVSSLSAALGSTIYKKPMGIIFGFFGGLFFGTYIAFLVDGPRAAFITSYLSPVLGVVWGYFITRIIEKKGRSNE
ncbi:MAG: hypothetical protein R6U17_05200 [Thermoplasmata archaeon]